MAVCCCRVGGLGLHAGDRGSLGVPPDSARQLCSLEGRCTSRTCMAARVAQADGRHGILVMKVQYGWCVKDLTGLTSNHNSALCVP